MMPKSTVRLRQIAVRSACFSSCVLLFTMARVSAAPLDATTSETDEVIRTEEDAEKGLENVKNVYQELEKLLAPRDIQKIKDAKQAEPYYKIIPGKEDPNTAKAKSTLIYQARYTPVKALSKTLEGMIIDGYAEYNEEQNIVLINDLSSNINDLRDAASAIDIPGPQVLVEAKVIELLFNDDMQRNLSVLFNQAKTGQDGLGQNVALDSSMGANQSLLGKGAQNQGAAMNWYPWVDGTKNLQVQFQWLMSAQDAKIVAAPNITLSRNQEATISTGQDLPIQTLQNTSSGTTQVATTFKNVGVTLRVEPTLIDGNSVTLVVNPQVSNVLQYEKVSQGTDSSGNAIVYQVPVISIRSIETQVTMESGQVVMMGGLYSNREVLNQERLPFFSDIPYIGELFTSKNRTKEIVQLVFILRVHIINPDEMVAGILYDPEAIVEEGEDIAKALQESPIMPKLQPTIEQVDEEFIQNPQTETE